MAIRRLPPEEAPFIAFLAEPPVGRAWSRPSELVGASAPVLPASVACRARHVGRGGEAPANEIARAGDHGGTANPFGPGASNRGVAILQRFQWQTRQLIRARPGSGRPA